MLIKLILIGCLQATAYRPVPWQTKPECTSRDHCRTSIDENVSELGVAVSQDLLASGKVRYRDVLYIDGVGYRIVNDCLNARIHNAVDVFVYSRAEERAFGVRHLNVYVVRPPAGENGNRIGGTMDYKKYAKKADTPSRLARKQARRGTFVANSKMAKAAHKAARAARQAAEREE